MSFQKIMVPFLDATSGRSAFETAAVLADRFKAHLDVIHMRQRISPALPGNAYYPIALNYIEENYEALTAAANKRAEELNKLFERLSDQRGIGFYDEEEHTEDKGTTAAWADVEATLPWDISCRARVSDLTVLARVGEDPPGYQVEVFEEIIFQSGRPALFVDAKWPVSEFPETVIVAWNGGREAARAITSAMPILRQAKHVFVILIGELRGASESPENVASYLKLHGVHATASSVRLNKGVDPEEEFIAHAKRKRADLIVMGGYSHSRWREAILGGFTRHMLKNSKIPILMAH